MMRSLGLLLFAILILGITANWENDWDRPLHFECPSSKSSITQIESIHNNRREDRRFNFHCRLLHEVNGSVSCSFSGYVNNFDEPVLHTCPNGGYLNGISSVHNNRREDRRYSFKCCTPELEYYHKNCRWTDWVNDWDRYFNYFVPSGYVIRGVHSVHNNKKEDRRFKFEICQVSDQ